MVGPRRNANRNDNQNMNAANPEIEVQAVVEANVAAGGQGPAVAAQAVDPAAIGAAVGAAVMQGLQQFLAPLLERLPMAGAVPGVAQGAAAGQQQPPDYAAYQDLPPPPPPPMQMPAQAQRYDPQVPSYYDVLRMMRELGMETFSGGTDPVRADRWRRLLERTFESARCPLGYRLELAVQYLRDEAHEWWEGVTTWLPEGNVLQWNDFRYEFNRKYFPQEAEDRLEAEFLKLEQGNRAVRDYAQEFNRLKRFAGREMSEVRLVKKFMAGLRVDIRNRCQLLNYASVIDLVEKAALTEKGIDDEARLLRGSHVRTTRVGEAPRQIQDNRGAIQGQGRLPMCGRCGRVHTGACSNDTRVCFGCGQPGHTKPYCPHARIVCSKCGRMGHMTKDCRVRPAGQQQGNQNREQLPPPPKRPTLGPRVFLAEAEDITADAAKDEYAAGQEYAFVDNEDAVPIAGMSCQIFL